ncbi:hypothetical protein ABID16_001021 [Rhizobium aquaticum]|uniref:Uncharacterized protein n=1 Tax=Rhizobium aquaticum TaxID=1549636 RepID=A0ABV2IX91_9HYPH
MVDASGSMVSEEVLSDEDVDDLREYRKELRSQMDDQYTTFDKAIPVMSGGAIAITVANVDKLHPFSEGVGLLLLLSWVVFGVSAGFNLLSNWTGAKDAEAEIVKLDECIRTRRLYSHGNQYRHATNALNFLAILLFMVGVCMLSAHAYYNMRRTTDETACKAATESTANPEGKADKRPCAEAVGRKADNQPPAASPEAVKK